MATVVTYGPGGFDPTKPDNNVISTEEVPDPPEPPVTTAEERLDVLLAAMETAATVGQMRSAARAAREHGKPE